jgi:SAM-dependent methyltransferase
MITNKSIELSDLQRVSFLALVEDFERLRYTLNGKGLCHTSFLGDFQPFHRPVAKGRAWPERALWKYWEMCMVITFSGISGNSTVLGVGESSTLLSFYLASKGATVYTIDLNPALIANANHVAGVMGWRLFNSLGDAADLDFPTETFDQVLSVCVLEHIKKQEQAIKEMARVLKPGGVLGLTFDYGYLEPGCQGFMSPDEIETRIIRPSGLEVIGNRHFSESPWQEEGWHGAWGALFLRKPVPQPTSVTVTWADKAEYSFIQQDIWQRLEGLCENDPLLQQIAQKLGETGPLLQEVEQLKQEVKRQADLITALRSGRVMRLMIAAQELWRRVKSRTERNSKQ